MKSPKKKKQTKPKCSDPYHDPTTISSYIYDKCPTCGVV